MIFLGIHHAFHATEGNVLRICKVPLLIFCSLTLSLMGDLWDTGFVV